MYIGHQDRLCHNKKSEFYNHRDPSSYLLLCRVQNILLFNELGDAFRSDSCLRSR